jgi:hypothetical protein
MKKLLFTLLLIGGFAGSSWATDPTLVSLGTQVDTFLASEGAAVTEFTTTGKSKLEILDGLVGIGKTKMLAATPYIAVVDGGLIQNSLTGGIGTSFGVHVNLLQTLGNYLVLSPSAKTFWSYLNLTPRASFDSDNVHHITIGATAGLAIPFN